MKGLYQFASSMDWSEGQLGSARPPAITSTQERPCPVCGAAARQRGTVTAKRAIGGGPLVIATCGECGASFQPTMPTEAALVEWYEYMGRVGTLATEPSGLLERRLTRLIDEVEPYRRGGQGCLLDVGCGRGALALAARDRGWDVCATEISATCVAELRPLFGERLHEGDLLDAPFPRASFDAILMIEVIEHLREPGAYLDSVLALLRPGGCVLLTTPNYRGLSARLRGMRWRVVADEHLTYYDPRSLRRSLREHGFASVRIATTGLDIGPLVRSIRSLGSRRATQQGITGTARSSPPSIAAKASDRAIELVNVVLRATRLGDGLRAIAERP